MKKTIIYADKINGLMTDLPEIDGLTINFCQDMEGVRSYLNDENCPFEMVLEVPNELVNLIDQEYGIND